MQNYDRIILGAGLYGLYSALFCGKRGEHVMVLERESSPFSRATYINQARVHMGYHYPRSISTALKSRHYFDRFVNDFGFCIKQDFDQVYATSSCFSWTSANQFQSFCKNASIPCEEIPSARYFRPGACDGAFLTKEFTYDALLLKEHLIHEIEKFSNIELVYSARDIDIKAESEVYLIRVNNEEPVTTGFVLNATYASVNQVLCQLEFQPFKIKYELCEIILCDVDERLNQVGLTVMDGPFFSIMPFGKSGLHSLTAVAFTPHVASYTPLPSFSCQKNSLVDCTPTSLGNCNDCPAKPKSAWPYMSSLAKKYLRQDYKLQYVKSLYSMKPILLQSEIDDSRPTVIRCFSEHPTFISVLSGKINTVYDLDEVLTK